MSNKKTPRTPTSSTAPKIGQKRITKTPSSSKVVQKRITKTSSASKIVQKRTSKTSSVSRLGKKVIPPSAPNVVKKENDNSIKATPVATKIQTRDPFLKFWIKFYNQALALTSSQNDTDSSPDAKEEDLNIDLDKHNKRVLVVLDSIIKLTFGIDGEKKAQVVAYGGGALELIVELVRSTGVLSSSSTSNTENKVIELDQIQRRSIIFTSVKAIKSCVVGNPAGRRRCRSAGVFPFISDTLDELMVLENAVLVEEVFTALAAICLGNDLNALQGSSQMEKYLTPANELYPDQREMQQKIFYLRTLFDAVRGEQSKIIQWFQEQQSEDEDEILSSAESSFFQEVIQAEAHPFESSPKQLVERYNRDVIQMQKYQQLTGLLDSIIVDLRSKRAAALLLNGDAEESLKDTRFLLEKNADSSTSKIEGFKLHSKALIQLGRMKEAGEYLGKLKILCGEDKEVISLLEKVKI